MVPAPRAARVLIPTLALAFGHVALAEWEMHSIREPWLEPVSVANADIDGDGHIDILAASTEMEQIAWWHNDGTGTIDNMTVISGDVGPARWIEAADMDGDGDTDAVVAASGSYDVSWWENVDGSGQQWIGHTVNSSLGYVFCAIPRDIDGDGDLDIIAAASNQQQLQLYRNTAGDASAFELAVIWDDLPHLKQVDTGDFDGDGDLDVLGSGYWSTLLGWFEQPGAPDPLAYFTLAITLTSPPTIPPSGGMLVYDVEAINQGLSPFPGITYWADVLLPNGNPYGPLVELSFTFPASDTLTAIGQTQPVPAFAPAGFYQLRAHLGDPDGDSIEHSAYFQKLATPGEAEPTGPTDAPVEN